MVVEKVFAVIAESTRRDILEALAQENKAVGQLVDELGVSQPTVSKHLRVLREAGVVTMRAQGQKRFYGINTEPLALVAGWLESLGATVPASAASAAAPVSAVPAPSAAGLAGAPSTAKPTPGADVPAAHVPAAAVVQEVRPAAPAVVTEAQPVGTLVPAAVNGNRAPQAAAAAVSGSTVAASAPASSAANGAAPARAAGTTPPNQLVVQSNENDGGVPGQISRSVGRAANKAADLLANL
ncbi:MAG: metalloregulator ArsR/SmtB family transcription factor, partial [Specibacter sp.]